VSDVKVVKITSFFSRIAELSVMLGFVFACEVKKK
jgi:hypothetical protein